MKKLMPLLIVFMLLTACQQVPAGGSPTALVPTPTYTASSTPTLTLSPTLTVHYSTELAPGVTYGPPALSESIYLEGAGGSGRDGLMTQAGMTEADLNVYENAAYDGAAKSGYAKDQIDIVYLYDKTHLSWNMVLRLKTGEYLWSQRITDGAYSTFPLQIQYDAAKGKIQWDTKYQLAVVAGSTGAEPFYTTGGYVELKGGSRVAVGADTYYSQWFNTGTGEWEDIAEVKAALQASLPDFYPGLAQTLDEFSPVNKADISAIIAALRAGPTLLDANAGPILIAQLMSRSDGYKYLTMYCNRDGIVNCAPAASIQFTDSINGQVRNPHVIIWEVMTEEGRRYIQGYSYDPVEMHYQTQYNTLCTNPRGPQTFNFVVGYPSDEQSRKPYEYSQTQQPGFLDAMTGFSEKGIITPEFEALIMLTTGY
jgi:hypothetical protein